MVGTTCTGNDDLAASLGQRSHRTPSAEVVVVGMGGDDQDSLDLGELQHRTSQCRIVTVLNSRTDSGSQYRLSYSRAHDGQRSI